jgi:hypothetical protein
LPKALAPIWPSASAATGGDAPWSCASTLAASSRPRVACAAIIIEAETEIGDSRSYRCRLGLDALK